MRRERPAVLLALGGYASVPAALGAVLWRVPIVVAEQNAVPGAANRLVARFAKASAVSFPDTALPRAVLTGNPVRREVRALAPRPPIERARSSVGLGRRRRPSADRRVRWLARRAPHQRRGARIWRELVARPRRRRDAPRHR